MNILFSIEIILSNFELFFFFCIVNSVILLSNKTKQDPIAKKLILRVSNRKEESKKQN